MNTVVNRLEILMNRQSKVWWISGDDICVFVVVLQFSKQLLGFKVIQVEGSKLAIRDIFLRFRSQIVSQESKTEFMD